MFTEDFKQTPYWWERTPRPTDTECALPNSAEALIVGSGYSGLSAAIQTARHGRHTVVVDAEPAGWGCSSRNGGQVSTSLKPSFQQLAKKFGAERALAILQEGNHAVAWLEDFIHQNRIQCDYQKVGRFHAAHTPAAFRQLSQKINATPAQLKVGAYLVSARQQRQEIGSEKYHGGAVYPRHASLDPARYHQGLLACAQANGVEIVTQCRVQAIQNKTADGKKARNGAGNFQVTTSKGVITAADIVLATSGYTGRVTPWQQRRIIPIGSYVIATEPLPQDCLARLIPQHRVVTDTRKLVMYYRLCPQRRRLLFGARVSLKETNLRHSARLLRRQMVDIFPALQNARISHSWMGLVGYTFDAMPHIGKHHGMYYSMGYCGSGISLASYFGMRVGLQVVGNPRGNTALDGLPFPSRLYYRGNPWFLAPSILVYRWRDGLLR